MVLGLVLLCPDCARASRELEDVVSHDWGPISASWVDVSSNAHARAAGPFYEYLRNHDGDEFLALRPLWSRWTLNKRQRARWDFLWPVASGKAEGPDDAWRFLLAYYRNWDRADPESRYRFWLIPLYFQGRSASGDSYAALFPIGGQIRDLFLWEKTSFFLFPLYSSTHMGGIHSKSFLWPIFSQTDGDQLTRFRIFPFYGWSELNNKWRKTFVMWPFWNQVKFFQPVTGGGWILFPLTGHAKMATGAESWWFLPPFFRYSKGGNENRLFGPWPFFQKTVGDVERFYLWPFYGYKKVGDTTKRYYLWPFVWKETQKAPDRVLKRTSVIPLSRTTSVSLLNEESGDFELAQKRSKFWPLYSWSRNEDATRLHIPELNPTRGAHIEQNWAAFWRLFRREQIGDDVDTEVLWGMYRSILRGEDLAHRSIFPLVDWGRDAQGGRFNLLKGIVGVERKGEHRTWRFLYVFRFGGEKRND